jgi:hypothetical protein
MNGFATLFEDPCYDEDGILDEDVSFEDVKYDEDEWIQIDELQRST